MDQCTSFTMIVFCLGKSILEGLQINLCYTPLILDRYLLRAVRIISRGSCSTNVRMFIMISYVLQFNFSIFHMILCILSACVWNVGCTYCPGNLPNQETFDESLYIVSIGGNDLTTAYFRPLSISQVMQNVVPRAVASISQSVFVSFAVSINHIDRKRAIDHVNLHRAASILVSPTY